MSAALAPPRDESTAGALAAVRRLVRSLRLGARRVEQEVGLTAAQLFVLREIAAAPGLSLVALARRTMTDRTSAAAAVERLAARGLVERGRAPDDRRRTVLGVSAAGRALLARAPHAPTTDLLAGLGRLSDAELAALAAGLTRLTDAMGLHDAPAEMLFVDGADATDGGDARPGSARARRTGRRRGREGRASASPTRGAEPDSAPHAAAHADAAGPTTTITPDSSGRLSCTHSPGSASSSSPCGPSSGSASKS